MYCRWLYCSYSERAATAFIHGIDGEVKLQTHTHAHACKLAHMHAHACKHAHMHAHACMHVHTHAHTNAHPAISQAFLYGASIPEGLPCSGPSRYGWIARAKQLKPSSMKVQRLPFWLKSQELFTLLTVRLGFLTPLQGQSVTPVLRTCVMQETILVCVGSQD